VLSICFSAESWKNAQNIGRMLVDNNKTFSWNNTIIDLGIGWYLVVVYRSSETSTNQSDVIIQSDDRFLNLAVDSDSIVSKIYMLNFVLCLVFFSVSILTKILQFYPSWFFFALILSNIWQFCPSVVLTLGQYTYLD
jgi:hypothetical protein